MKPSAKYLGESLLVAAPANGFIWTAQDISTGLAIAVSAITFVWILVQLIRFIQLWIIETRTRKAEKEAQK